MSTMRAIVVKGGHGPIESLTLSNEVPMPQLRDNQVLVKIKAFGLNRMDIHQRQGAYPVPEGVSELLGVEFSGTVAALGAQVSKWKIGDAVFGLAGGGAYAEYIAVSEDHIIVKPESLSWTVAASIPEAWLTAYQALVVIADLKPGENVLIHAGASGVGVAANQIARYLGAKHVITTASTKDKLDWLLSLPEGPTHAVNYKTQDFAAEVKSITGGRGVDVVVDVVGQSHWAKNIDSLALDGRMVCLAFMSGDKVPDMSLQPILYKRLRIQGSTLRARSEAYQADLIQRFGGALLGDLSAEDGPGKLKSYIYKVYPWTEIQVATREMEDHGNSGKIIVEVV